MLKILHPRDIFQKTSPEKRERLTLNWEQGEIIDHLWIRIDFILDFHAYVYSNFHRLDSTDA
ncbi:MAG: hypothetical protein F6K22_13220 [Okeania sp. SIO2F4]|nr:hypothetical protein [Okeania sp. SIO2F4]